MVRTREEQIEEISRSFTNAWDDCPNSKEMAHAHVLEAEQRGYERARAECAEDTKRLDWLCRMMRGSEARRMLGTIANTGDLTLWRQAIDAAMKGDENV